MSHYAEEREAAALKADARLHAAVYTPKHYAIFADNSMEAIDVIRSTLTREEFAGFLKGNILKYRLRVGEKDNIAQEIAKANNYNRMLREFAATKE